MTVKRGRAAAFLLLLVLISTGMFLLNSHTPLMMDDYDYSFSWHSGARLSGLADIVASQAAHYMIWGGRSVVHFLAQLFLYWGKAVFNIANTLAYLLLLIEIVYLSRRKDSPWDWRLLLIAHGMLFFLTPFFGVVFLWLDGACNYLWGTVLALLPLAIIRSEREGGFFDTDASRAWLALPVSFLSGWTNENTACGVLAALFLLMAWDKLRGRRIRGWRAAAWLLQAIGTAVLLLAPGNFARAGGGSERSFVMEMLYRAAVVSYCVLRYAGIPVLTALVLAIWARRKGAKLRIEWLVLLGVSAFLCAYALVGSPQISDRSFTSVLVLAACALLSVCADMMKKPRRRDALIGCLLALCMACGMGAALSQVQAHEAAWHGQVARVETAVENGESVVAIASLPSVSRYTMSITLADTPQQWPNSTLSKYYGIEISGE